MSAGYMLITPRQFIVYADDRYFATMKKRAVGCVVRPPTDIKSDMKTVRSCAFEAEDVTVARLARLKKAFRGTTFIPSIDVIEQYRRAKNAFELRSIRKACRITKKILQDIPRLLTPRISEAELSRKITEIACRYGAECMAFDTIVGFGENTANSHHRPTQRRLKKGDMVQIDMGVKINGYCSDYSRVYFTGPLSANQKKVWRALRQAKKSAINLVKAGASIHALDKQARRILKQYGFGPEFNHALGHGVGLDIHEGVTISQKRKDMRLLRSEVITIEPGLYFPGEWGMRLEDTVIVR